MTKFSEIPWFIIKAYISDVLSISIGSTYSDASDGTFFSDENLIVTKSNNPFKFYKKNSSSNYVEVKGLIDTACADYTEYNRLRLKRLFEYQIVPSNTILKNYTQKDLNYSELEWSELEWSELEWFYDKYLISNYDKTTYDYFSDTDYQYDITNGDEIYIRKDQFFIEWIENNWSSYEDFINPEVKYLYIGKAYKDDTYIYINHYAFKDWMLDALPRNNRNDTLDEFFYNIYDQLYHKIYSMERNLFTLFDPYEIDSDLLDDIMTMYNEIPLSSDIDIYKRRVYTANIIYWLKKKGTYAALFIIWYILTKETNNDLIVYDRWHSLSVSSGSPSGYFEDYDYTNFYDASVDYPITFTTNSISGSSIHNQTTSSTSWSVAHDLNTTDLITQVYNWDLDKIIPKNIEIVDSSNITIDFGTSAAGFVLMAKTDYTEIGNGIINHLLEEQYVISQHYKSNYLMNSYSVEATDSDNLTVETSASGVDNYILLPEYTHNQSAQSSTWTINHNLGYIGVVADVYDGSDKKIIPNSISLNNENKCIITFSEPVSGSCGITSVSDVNEALNTTKVLSTHYKVEMYLNNNPFGTNILSENLMKDMYNKWENNRPVTKFSHYHLNLPITTDFSGTETQLFNDPIHDSNIYSKSITYGDILSNVYVHSQTASSTEWIINHKLDTENIITHVYDLSLNRIVPYNIEIINKNNVKITFLTSKTGAVFVAIADYYATDSTETTTKVVNHNLNNQYVISQFYEEKLLKSDTITATDANTLTMETSGTSGNAFIIEPDYTHNQLTGSSIWTINHNLGYRASILNVYNHNDEKIMPNNISLDTINTCTLTFSEPVSGNCGIIPIGNPIISLATKFSGTWDIKIGNGSNLALWDYSTNNDIKNTFYTVNCSGSDNFTEETTGARFEFSIPKDVEGYITEIGIFNNNSNLTWFSKIDNIYKHKDVIMDVNYFAQFEDL